MPNIYNPIDLSELDAINAQVNTIKTVLPVSNGVLVNTEEHAIDVVGKALKDGNVNNSGVEILYDTVQDANNEISIRLKSVPNTIFYANENGLLMPLQIGNDFIISNGVLSTVKGSRSIAKNKLIYTTASTLHTNWYAGLTSEYLYDGEGGSGTGTGSNGMIAEALGGVDITVSFSTPKWINAFKVYPGQFNSPTGNAPELVEVFVGNSAETSISIHSLIPGVIQTIDTTLLDAYTNAGKHAQYTFRFKNSSSYVSIMELVLWGDD